MIRNDLATDQNVRERPILMSAPMVRAILDGRKTQTRRAVKPQPNEDGLANFWEVNPPPEPGPHDRGYWINSDEQRVKGPYGVPGDRLWVRETWGWSPFASMPPSADYKQFVVYAADDPAVGYEFRARPSIHMPRWACRIVLELTDVRVERLQDISEEDAKAEGAEALVLSPDWSVAERGLIDWPCMDAVCAHRNGYGLLWDSLNAKRGFGWDVNPWVWVLSFRRVT